MKKIEYYERAKHILTYDTKTGQLFRTLKDGKIKEAGTTTPLGYRQVSVTVDGKRKLLLAHRIVWFIHHGELPDMLDHVDGEPMNNRNENLRPATYQQNLQNRRSSKTSTSKYLGVNWCKRDAKWRANIQINGKTKYLGLFTDESEAAKAYDKAARKHFGEYANPNFDGESRDRTGDK